MSEFFRALVVHEFLQVALLACVLASVGCGAIGAYVVVKRISFLAGGIAHTILAGMGIAYYLNRPPMLGAAVCAVIAAILIGVIKLRRRQDEDILIAACWSVGMAIGVIFISQTPGYNVDLMSYLFGNILLVSKGDLALMLALDVIILATIYLGYKQIVGSAFDEEFARTRGVNIEAVYILMLCLTALTVVLLIQIVGLALVIALLVLPAAAAALFAHSLARLMQLSIGFCMLITTSGLALSYQPDLPAGASIIITAGVFYCVALLGHGYFYKR